MNVKGLLLSRGCRVAGALLVLSGSPVAASWAAIRGQVLAPEGRPVADARIQSDGGHKPTHTDSRGRFELSLEAGGETGEAFPLVLLVTHPGFHDKSVQVVGETGSLEIRLDPRQAMAESLQVVAIRAGDGFSPGTVTSTPVDLTDSTTLPSTLTEAVSRVTGVSENGQGGRFQVFSIRGLSRHRVLSLVSGARIVGDRRAGVSTSFVDPFLAGEVDVLRGPASTYFGSGALGGAVQISPRRFQGLWLWSGYDSQGDEGVQALGWGRDGWSLGVAHRQAGDGETAAGGRLNNAFEQFSATLEKTWSWGGRSARFLALPAYATDIGKANTDYPRRTTRYPYERHLVLSFGLESPRSHVRAFLHPHGLRTEVTEGDTVEEVVSESVDFGGHWEWEVVRRGGVAARFGVDYFGRRQVETTETSWTRGQAGSVGSRGQAVKTLDDGQEDEGALFAVVSWQWRQARFEAGGRFTRIRQSNHGQAHVEPSALVGFVGAALPLSARLELVANLGTGQRFANLSEQFFSGTTGRGTVLGNPDLDPEMATNSELGLRWLGDRIFLRGSLFRNRIDDYIERFEITPDLLSFSNLTSGTIDGAEVEGFAEVGRGWNLSWGGHVLRGRDLEERPLPDVPPHGLELGTSYATGPWAVGGRLEWRSSKDDAGSGEKEIPQAWLLAVTLRYDLGGKGQGMSLVLKGANLLDEEYFSAADRKAPLAAGRSIGLGLAWSRR